MRARTLLVLLLLALAAAAFLGVRWRQAETRFRETSRWTHFVMDSLATTVHFPPPPADPWERDSIYWQWVATGAQLQSRRWQQAVRYWVERRSTLLELVDVELLKQQGLEDPERQLRSSLLARSDLIPFEGVLGGTMGFAPGENIILLSPPYAFATFEDGHIGGSMLLEYSVRPGPEIVWTRLWTRLD